MLNVSELLDSESPAVPGAIKGAAVDEEFTTSIGGAVVVLVSAADDSELGGFRSADLLAPRLGGITK